MFLKLDADYGLKVIIPPTLWTCITKLLKSPFNNVTQLQEWLFVCPVKLKGTLQPHIKITHILHLITDIIISPDLHILTLFFTFILPSPAVPRLLTVGWALLLNST